MDNDYDCTVLATDLAFPEGPVVMKDGTVLVAELRSGLVRRVHPDGRVSLVADCGGGPNGLAIGPDGALYVCNNGGSHFPPGQFVSTGPSVDYVGGSIQRVDLRNGTVNTLYTHCGEHRLSAPNDLVFDAHGGFWFTDFGKKKARTRDFGGLYYALPDGSSIVEVQFGLAAPNGIGLSPDGRTVYVAETENARLWAYDIVGPGVVKKLPFPSPTGGRLVCGVGGYQRFDSLKVDGDGNICVATLMTGAVTVIAPSGELVRQVKLPDVYVTNLAFGGDDLRTAYVTLAATGQLARITWPTRGLKLNYNA